MNSVEQLTPVQLKAVDNWWDTEDGQRDFDYRDNWRYADKSNPEQVAEYDRIKEDGCCGSYDTELTCEDGSILLFGFNYGH